MATVPLSGTNIKLLKGIPFSNDYRNTRWFANSTAQNTYFNARTLVHSMATANFQRMDDKTFVRCDQSIDDLFNVNYIRFQNATYDSKWFYAFVTKLEYINRNTTYVHFEIDVIQTWMFDLTFKKSYVIREHADLGTTSDPVINTVDEGLNYGTEYDVVEASHIMPPDSLFWLVIAAKQTLHSSVDVGLKTVQTSRQGIPQPLSFYVVPFHPIYMNFAYVLEDTFTLLSPIEDVLREIYGTEDAQNNIVSLYVTEHIGFLSDLFYNSESDIANITLTGTGFVEAVTIAAGTVSTIHIISNASYSSDDINLGNKYSGLTALNGETKLLMHPYAFTELTDYHGNKVELKNEYITEDDLIITVLGSLGSSNKVAYIPKNYNVTGDLDGRRINLDHALINSSPQDVPILTDMLASYMQGNRNSIAVQKQTIRVNQIGGALSGIVGGVAAGVAGNYAGVAAAGVSVARGAADGQMQLAAINAKQKDIDNQPPQLTKMGSNVAFEFGNGYSGFYMLRKQIKPEYQKKLADYFKVYGYKINEVKMPNFATRESWNYIQTNSCNITGDFNAEDLNELKSVFNNGITLWHNDDVGNYDLSNGVV